MNLTWYNKNYVGTHFGGSLYSMVDPWYMLMLIKNLGPDYIVWDKAAYIKYLKPGKGKVSADFILSEEIIDEIRKKVDENQKINYEFKVKVMDEKQQVVADVTKVIYIRRKNKNVI